jgi:AraC-like DNA-binding protein
MQLSITLHRGINMHIMEPNVLDLNWSAQIFPRLRLAGRFDFADRDFAVGYTGQHHTLHVHEYAGTFDIDGQCINLQPGDFTYSAPRTITRYHVPRAGRHWCIHFVNPLCDPYADHDSVKNTSVSPGLVDATDKNPATQIYTPYHLRLGKTAAEAINIFARISEMFALSRKQDDRTHLHSLTASVATLDLLLWMNHHAMNASRDAQGENQPGRKNKLTGVVDQVIALLRRHIVEPLSVTDISREMGVSQARLAVAFRKKTGLSIHLFQTKLRIEQACVLLTTTSLPVGLISRKCGFNDPQHFNKVFRRFKNVSPSDYRNQIMDKSE